MRQFIINGWDNGLSPGRRQAIISTNAGILLIGPLGTNFSEILIEIHIIFIQENAFENILWEMPGILSRPQYVNQTLGIKNWNSSLISKGVCWLKWCSHQTGLSKIELSLSVALKLIWFICMNQIGLCIYLICYELCNKISYPKNGYADVFHTQIDLILPPLGIISVQFLL